MDTLIVLIATALTQLSLGYSDIEHTPSAGLMLAEYTRFANFKAKAIKANSGRNYMILDTSYNGLYGIDFDFLIENKIPLGKSSIWVGTKAGWAPIKQAVKVVMRLSEGARPTTKSFVYYESPSYGLTLGYDLWGRQPKRYIFPWSFSPYFSASFMQVGYSGFEDETDVNYDSVVKLALGVKMQMDAHWDVMMEVNQYNIEMRSQEGNLQDINLHVRRYRLGVSYNFTPKIIEQRDKKDATYEDIIRAIDPALDLRKEIINEEKSKAPTSNTPNLLPYPASIIEDASQGNTTGTVITTPPLVTSDDVSDSSSRSDDDWSL